jgi:hypothetical protein
MLPYTAEEAKWLSAPPAAQPEAIQTDRRTLAGNLGTQRSGEGKVRRLG